MTLVVDYPWSHPSAASLQAAGVYGVMRYLSTDPTKNLTRAEADDLAAHGIWSGAVWETTAARALAGQAAGANDAHSAAAQAAACGMPSSRPIYFAVDTDTGWASVEPYATGWASVLGPARSGVYGGLQVIRGAITSGLVSWYWQTSAWSGGVWDNQAHLRQGGSITIGGVDCDRNTAMTNDYGQWMPGRTPQEDIVTPEDIQNIANAVAPAVWNYQVPDWGLDENGNAKPLGTSKAVFWHVIWNDVDAAKQQALGEKILAAAQAAKLTPAEIAQALVDGTLKLQISIEPAAQKPAA